MTHESRSRCRTVRAASVAAGTSVARIRGRPVAASWRSLPWPAVVNGELVDLSFALDADARVRLVTPDSPGGARPLPPQHRAPDGRRRHEPVPRRPVRHRPGHRRRVLLRLRRRRARSCPRTSRPSRRRWGSSPTRDLPYERRMLPKEEAKALLRAARRAAQGAAHRREGRPRRLVLHHRRRLRRLLHRPARAVDRPAEGLQAAVDVERLLEGRRAQPADAAHLRHRVLQRGRPQGAPRSASRRRRSATTGSSAGSSACSCSTRGRRAQPFWLAKGTTLVQHARQLHARRARPRRATSR